MEKLWIGNFNIHMEDDLQPKHEELCEGQQIIKLSGAISPALVFTTRKDLETFTNNLMQLVWDVPKYEELEQQVEDLKYKLQVAADSYNEIANSKEVMNYD